MKDKIVFWGTNEQNEELLVLLRLRANDNIVDIWTFLKNKLEEPFIEKMFQDWDNINIEDLPEPHQHIERSMSEPSLLPDEIKTTSTEIVNRAEKEWFVKVLAVKLVQKLSNEVGQLKERVFSLQSYDSESWDIAKSYWAKVNKHFQERDLSRDEASKLRGMINEAFGKLKELRKVENEAFDSVAKANFTKIMTSVEGCMKGVNDRNKKLGDLFEELKRIQNESKGMKLTRAQRIQIKKNLDIAFEAIRNERRDNFGRRLEARFNGLMKAIDRMEKSINRDRESLDFQSHRMEKTQGQLEAQLREAKIQMIRSRVESKDVKLKDMYKTLDELKAKLKEEREKAAKAIEREKEMAAKRAAAAKKRAEEAALKAQKAKEKKAAQRAKAEAEKAAAKEKASVVADQAKEQAAEVKEKVVDGAEAVKEQANAVVDQAKEQAAEVKEKVADGAEAVKEQANAVADQAKEQAAEVKEKVADGAEAVKEQANAVADQAKEQAVEVKEKVADGVDNVFQSISEKIAAAKKAAEEAKAALDKEIE